MATGIGDTLRDARQQRGLSLEDAAAETRIRATHLAALEQEEFARLGGDVYVRGFIRSYAKLLGLDPAPLLEAYGGGATGPAASPQPPPRMSLGTESLERSPRRGVGVGVAVAALVAIIGLTVFDGEEPPQVDLDDDTVAGEPDDRDEPDATSREEPATPPSVDPTATPSASQSPPPGAPDRTAVDADGIAVLIEVTERNAWVRALIDGDEVFQGTLEPGASERFEGDDEVRLRIGDPGAVELIVNGESHGSPGADGQPVWVTVGADGDVAIS